MSSGYSLGSYSNPLNSQKIVGNAFDSPYYSAAHLPHQSDWETLLQLPSHVDCQLDFLCQGGMPSAENNNNNNNNKEFQPVNTASLDFYSSAQNDSSCVLTTVAPRTSSATGSDMSEAAYWEHVGKQALIPKTEAINIKVSDQDNISDFDSLSQTYDSANDEEDDKNCVDEGEIAKEPWFRTLKSAGVRIKGRTKRELVEVAERIRKRRRESAARSRARRMNKVSTIADQNDALRQENEELKRLIEQIQTRQASETMRGCLLQEQSGTSF